LLLWKEKLTLQGGRLILFGIGPSIEYPMWAMPLHRVLTFCLDREVALAQLPEE
jgi:hypothetical protein